MLSAVLAALHKHAPPFELEAPVIDCHHNYVAKERHYGADVYRHAQGRVRARDGELGIIPGSMGARSFIVRGKGNPQSFHSCSHGAGRSMSRGEARRRFSLDDHRRAREGVECRVDSGVLDETPAAYKPIDAVMNAQRDLVDVVARAAPGGVREGLTGGSDERHRWERVDESVADASLSGRRSRCSSSIACRSRRPGPASCACACKRSR